MDRYFLKQPQNIIVKVKKSSMELEKKNSGKKLSEIHTYIYIAFILSGSQLIVQIYLHQEKLFS